MNFRETLKSIGIIPVIQINDAEKAVPLALALKKGGLPAAEVTFRTDAAEEAIRRIKIEVPDVCVCAGTVLNVKTAERAVKAGAVRARTRRSCAGALRTVCRSSPVARHRRRWKPACAWDSIL